MAGVEALLARHGIEVAGYAATRAPEIESVPSTHAYLQGNDGGYVDGRIYLNEEINEDCIAVVIVHELVHDASVKYRLFAGVPNAEIKSVLEALADTITAAASEDPFRPGCVRSRRLALGAADLAKLAATARSP